MGCDTRWEHPCVFSPQVPREDVDLSDAEKVCAECDQPRPLPWKECVLPHRMKRCVKIGEGTFGEVFSTTNASGDTVALKVCICPCMCMCVLLVTMLQNICGIIF